MKAAVTTSSSDYLIVLMPLLGDQLFTYIVNITAARRVQPTARPLAAVMIAVFAIVANTRTYFG
jgi:hypothetical protein